VDFASVLLASHHKNIRNRFTYSPVDSLLDNIHRTAVQNAPKMQVIHSHVLDITGIVNLRLRGERGHSYAHFIYRIVCQSQTCGLHWAGNFGFEFMFSLLIAIQFCLMDFCIYVIIVTVIEL